MIRASSELGVLETGNMLLADGSSEASNLPGLLIANKPTTLGKFRLIGAHRLLSWSCQTVIISVIKAEVRRESPDSCILNIEIVRGYKPLRRMISS